MVKLKLYFTIFRKEIYLIIQNVDNPKDRNHAKVKNLINPNQKRWLSDKQRFDDVTKDDIYNNEILDTMMFEYSALLEPQNFASGKAFKQYVKDCKAKGNTANKIVTLGDYLITFIERKKNDKENYPTRTYKLYITLLNKLKEENDSINVSINDIEDKHFIRFGEWMKSVYGRTGWFKNMSCFSNTVKLARSDGYKGERLSYMYSKHVPRKNGKKEKRQALSINDYNKFVNLDVSTVKCRMTDKDKELRKDFAIFEYEMKMRPCDVLKLHKDDIKGGFIYYIPLKLRNKDVNETIIRLTPKAKEIIKKYMGKSSEGYIFPFEINEHVWIYDDNDSYNEWYRQKENVIESINRFLHKVEKMFGIKKITNYTFRHSTITHEINAGKKSLMQIAYEAATSVKMESRNYFDGTAEYNFNQVI